MDDNIKFVDKDGKEIFTHQDGEIKIKDIDKLSDKDKKKLVEEFGEDILKQ